MNPKQLVCLLLTACLALTASAQDSTWQPVFITPDVTISMPEKPIATDTMGKAKVVTGEHEGNIFVLTYIDTNFNVKNGNQLMQAYDGFVIGYLKSNKSKLATHTSSDTSINGSFGEWIHLTDPKKKEYQESYSYAILANGHFYVISLISSHPMKTSDSLFKNYFSSLQFPAAPIKEFSPAFLAQAKNYRRGEHIGEEILRALPYIMGLAMLALALFFVIRYRREKKRAGLSILLFLLVPHHTHAQRTDQMLERFALVRDRDGYSNIRKDTGLSAKIDDTLHNDHFVYCLDSTGRWISIEYSTKKSHGLTGYIYRNRVRFITDYENIPRISKEKFLFGKDSLKIEITGQSFVKSRYHLSYAKHNPTTIESINAQKYWGTDGEMPRRAYKSITATLGSRQITLPNEATEDLFEPSLANTRVNYDRKNDILYIHSANSDGAGGYSVIWKIEKGAYAGRYIADGL